MRKKIFFSYFLKVQFIFYTVLKTILKKNERGLGGLVVYSSDSHGDGTGSILAAAFGYTLETTDLYGG